MPCVVCRLGGSGVVGRAVWKIVRECKQRTGVAVPTGEGEAERLRVWRAEEHPASVFGSLEQS